MCSIVLNARVAAASYKTNNNNNNEEIKNSNEACTLICAHTMNFCSTQKTNDGLGAATDTQFDNNRVVEMSIIWCRKIAQKRPKETAFRTLSNYTFLICDDIFCILLCKTEWNAVCEMFKFYWILFQVIIFCDKLWGLGARPNKFCYLTATLRGAVAIYSLRSQLRSMFLCLHWESYAIDKKENKKRNCNGVGTRFVLIFQHISFFRW